jgi:hypothetical protein
MDLTFDLIDLQTRDSAIRHGIPIKAQVDISKVILLDRQAA